MEKKGNKAIWALIIVAGMAVLIFMPLLKGVTEGLSDRARDDAVFGFGILTLVALLILGCVAIISRNLRH